ncbi:protein NO VEIN domain-containing protein [Geothrix alkalitolerans]|uniref:protein NO VEIN domain-containing protein n=1 Tax=Geothrix alkalitolerans TaxID=2922724 RepID=UPI001FAFA1C4
MLFSDALTCLDQHKRSIGRAFRGRFVQIFLGMKFFQNNIPSMYSGSFIATEVLQSLLDDLFAKTSRPPNSCVLSLFEGNYLARTGLIRPGNTTPQNTWRNNLNLQKGIGCYAPPADLSSPTFLNQDRSLCRYLLTPPSGNLAGAKCSLCTTEAAYRSESHRKWLRIDPVGSGYAATDLQSTTNFAPYVAPGGVRIPLLPLIVALYHDADPGLSVGMRTAVSMDDFASDFNFTLHEISTYFDISMSHPLNAKMTTSAAWVPGSVLGPSAQTSTGGSSAPGATLVVPAIAQPVLGGTPVPPPNTNNGWDAEQYVAAALTAAGWTTHIVSRQQLGYDIFVQRGAQKRYVEVKSSLGLCSPSLTSREWQQAKFHGHNYILAISENFNSAAQNVIYWIPDPANRCSANPQTTISHGIARSSWTCAAIPLANI